MQNTLSSNSNLLNSQRRLLRKPFLVILVTFFVTAAASFYFFNSRQTISFISPLSFQAQEKIKPLEKYSFANLKQAEIPESKIVIEEIIDDTDSKFTAHLFSFISSGKRITGQINIPTKPEPVEGFPVILMLRGYIDPETYRTGDGTRKAAAFFAGNGFVTIAPDFLGFGGSDDPDENSIAARVKRPYNLLVLLNSLDSLSFAIRPMPVIWGHSNGGQIALSLLEITGKQIPTVLWAPVSKPFPYSILYYTDEYDDRGKALRKVVAKFEEDYDIDKYSITLYHDWIKAPIQIHQGTSDDAVPKDWSDELVAELKKLGIEVTYYIYPGADHNLRPSWNTVINRDLTFFKNYLAS